MINNIRQSKREIGENSNQGKHKSDRNVRIPQKWNKTPSRDCQMRDMQSTLSGFEILVFGDKVRVDSQKVKVEEQCKFAACKALLLPKEDTLPQPAIDF